MSLHSRTSVLVTSGNQSIPTTGDFRNPTTRKPNLRVGQLAFVDPVTNKFLAPADLPNSKNISIYVGTGDNTGSRAKVVKKAGMGRKGINFCKASITAKAKAPACGTQEYVDVFFDCLDAFDAITLKVKIKDWYSKAFRPMNEDDEHLFTVPTSELNPCSGDCDPVVQCKEAACRLVDKINDKGEKQRDPSLNAFAYRSGVFGEGKQLPATAGILYDNEWSVQEFCIGLENTTCKDCAYVSEIEQLSGGGIITSPITIEGVGLDGRIAHDDMADVLEQINAGINPLGGYAHLQRGVGNCCQYKLIITSCATEAFSLQVKGAAQAPCANSNPFGPITYDPICEGCGSTPVTKTFTCGIRIYTDMVDLTCYCDGANDPYDSRNYLSRHIDANFENPYLPGSYYVRKSEPAEAPAGLGFQLAPILVADSQGGTGRDHRSSDVFRGYLGRLDADSPHAKAKGLDCKAQYCAIDMVVKQEAMPDLPVATAHYPAERILFAFPDADETTKTDFEAYLAVLDTMGRCPGGVALSCSVNSVVLTQGSLSIVGPDTVANGETVDYDAVSTEAQGELKGTWVSSAPAQGTIDPNTGTLTMIDGSTPFNITFTYTNPGGATISVTKAVQNPA